MAASEAELARRTMWLGEVAAFLSVIATMFRGPNGGVQNQNQTKSRCGAVAGGRGFR